MYTPLCWIRRIEKLNATHIFADILIVVTVLIILAFGSNHVIDHGWGEGVVAVNKKTFLDMIGFAIFAYEGVGVILPIMDTTEDES